MARGISQNIIDAVGDTPLVRLRRYLDVDDVTLFAKLEGFNPGGSAKDRPAKLMVERAISRGLINQETIIVESSSGNMGIGLAQVCRYHGLKFICVVDVNAQPSNVSIIRALGATIRLVDTPVNGDFLTARLAVVREICDGASDTFWPNQYANSDNPAAHALGAIAELINQVDSAPDYLFVATSSTGTIQGCQHYVTENGLNTKLVAVDAEGSVLFSGTAGRRRISGMGAGLIPPLAAGHEFDDVSRISDVRAVYGCRRAVSREALLIGGSGGAVLEAVRARQSELSGLTAAVIIHDSGSRYMDTVFSDSWVERELETPVDALSDYDDCNFH